MNCRSRKENEAFDFLFKTEYFDWIAEIVFMLSLGHREETPVNTQQVRKVRHKKIGKYGSG